LSKNLFGHAIGVINLYRGCKSRLQRDLVQTRQALTPAIAPAKASIFFERTSESEKEKILTGKMTRAISGHL